ncbi:MAG: beta-N-acetylhexosaminidase [Cryomorphaceae bacterium]|nr:beta-N-acetylhexosaminidase [Cryomorphaceae bacterium]
MKSKKHPFVGFISIGLQFMMALPKNNYRIFSTLLVVGSLFLTLGCADNHKKPIHIIPIPNQIKYAGGTVDIKYPLKAEYNSPAKYLHEYVDNHLSGWNAQFVPSDSSNNSYFPVIFLLDAEHSESSYNLVIQKNKVLITASSEKGHFYGYQTFKQILFGARLDLQLPKLSIDDAPNYAWRGYMLDEARYFFGKEFVKNLLHELAELKINTFHWHLTDDAGWRIEIKKYPRLTEVGAFRENSQIEDWDSPKRSDEPHGGFYTQEDILEIVEYAQSLHIDIIPEINMPGHASAAIAAYPELGILGNLRQVPVVFGKHPDAFNIADESVITFLKDVIEEVISLFPHDIIHIGGDEVLYETWANSRDIQNYMRANELESPAAAQVHFTNFMAWFLKSKGKRLMGWNEILGANIHDFDSTYYNDGHFLLDKNAIVHFWKGDTDLMKSALEQGYQVVNALHTETYLDYSHKNLPLSRIYKFRMIPAGISDSLGKNIIGASAQMWTEWTPTAEDVTFQTFPRIAAFAEATWSKQKNYQDFLNRMIQRSKIYNERQMRAAYNEIK